MKTSHVNQVQRIVVRSAQNYPAVSLDLAKEVKDQSLELLKAQFNFTRLLIKALCIWLFPLWILPLALALIISLYVFSFQTITESYKNI